MIDMITTTCFSICGYFRYPIINNHLLLDFLNRVYKDNMFAIDIELLNSSIKNNNLSSLLSSEEYLTIKCGNLSVLNTNNYTPLSIHFKNIYSIESEILLFPIDDDGFEIEYLLEEEALENTKRRKAIIKECAKAFFETLRPLYGCCGTEMFVDGINDIDEDDIMNSKFYCIGYVDYSLNYKFDFLNMYTNKKEFELLPLENGNLYLRNNYWAD